jgi:anti-sigma factor RsiW
MTESDDIEVACNEWVELITAYVEGTLDAKTVVAIDAHLALCPTCVTYLEQITETIATLGHLPVADTLSDQAKRELVTAFRELNVPPR